MPFFATPTDFREPFEGGAATESNTDNNCSANQDDTVNDWVADIKNQITGVWSELNTQIDNYYQADRPANANAEPIAQSLESIRNMETDLATQVTELQEVDNRLDTILSGVDPTQETVLQDISTLSNQLRDRNDLLVTANRRSEEKPEQESYVVLSNALVGGKPVVLGKINNLILISFFVLVVVLGLGFYLYRKKKAADLVADYV